MDSFVTAAAFFLLWSQWETGGVALPLSSVYDDVHFTTSPSSSIVLIQNDALYREHKEERTDTDNNSVKNEKMHMP